ncbi:MAG: serine/threonine-protein kinase [Planctomycetota bacterium]|jgi:serine/threonine-protein kinase|nr:serine/threonine-protein kinase [Planctomycetota bacterium]MDP6838959.1 serine/threonine-protein kinase [Planctomycetota bacterium]MDP6957083.1 serine/threonine-protein kinase [Planctomycetota bacterium]
MALSESDYLALLVHRGWLNHEQVASILPELKAGEALDELLAGVLGWEAVKVARLRRTEAGRIFEVPGFEMLGELGSGGTAEVFRCREKKTGEVMALKVLQQGPAGHALTKAAFVREAKLLARLEHPGIVKGFGVARAGEVYFSKMEVIPGRTLLEVLDDGEPLDEGAALTIILTVAEALAYMAGLGLVHRDVKPGNIMWTEEGEVKLIDLGFAAGAGEASAADSAVGTAEYLSPEQARGGAAADLRSDIYSLGVTLFQLVIGRLPFEGSDNEEVLRKQVMDSLSSPELKGRGLSPHLHYFIEKMMAKDAEVRHQSWKQLIEDIRQQLAGRESLDYEGQVRDERGKRGGRGFRR